jgi:hypothetical protein
MFLSENRHTHKLPSLIIMFPIEYDHLRIYNIPFTVTPKYGVKLLMSIPLYHHYITFEWPFPVIPKWILLVIFHHIPTIFITVLPCIILLRSPVSMVIPCFVSPNSRYTQFYHHKTDSFTRFADAPDVTRYCWLYKYTSKPVYPHISPSSPMKIIDIPSMSECSRLIAGSPEEVARDARDALLEMRFTELKQSLGAAGV